MNYFAALVLDGVTTTDWAVLGACLALAAATLIFIFYIQPDASDLAPHRTKLDQLLERRDNIYDNLRDLRFEFRSGLDLAHRHAARVHRDDLVVEAREAALVLAEIDQVTESQVRRPRGPRPAAATRGPQ